jgi:hypothetical protein
MHLSENIELWIQSGNQGIYGHLYFFKHHPDINKRQKYIAYNLVHLTGTKVVNDITMKTTIIFHKKLGKCYKL